MEIRAPRDVAVEGPQGLFAAAAAALLVVAAGLQVARWYAAGTTVAIWEVVGTLTAAVFVTGRHLLPEGPDPTHLGLAEAATWSSGAVLLLGGFRVALGPEVEERQPARWIVSISAAAMGSLTLLVLTLDSAGQASDGWARELLVQIGLTAALCALALALTVRAYRTQAGTAAWFGLFVLSLAAAEALDTAGPPSTSAMAGLAVGAVCAVCGAERGLRAAFDLQARALGAARAETSAAEAQARALHAAARERAHEAHNALGAVSAAVQTLERYQDQMRAATKEQLAAGIMSEISRLQRLVDIGGTLEAATAFEVDATIAPVINGARASGLNVIVDVPSDIWAFAGPQAAAEVVQNLLVNVSRHAPGSPATVAASLEGNRVVVTVADRGPGVPAGQRSTIFERDHSSADEAGHGLGLYISRRLARAYGGELRVDPRPGGGATFVLHLPAGSATRPGSTSCQPRRVLQAPLPPHTRPRASRR